MEYEVITKKMQHAAKWSGGKTTELAIYPKHADVKKKDFIWRLSSATCKKDKAKFTDYTGFNRVLLPLEGTAKIRAKELVSQFSHTRPNGSVCFTAYPQGMMAMGENIAYGFSSAQAVTEAWKETNEKYSGQGHRRNMLSDDFNAVGIAGYIH